MEHLNIGIPVHDARVHVECMSGVLDCWGNGPCSIQTVKGSYLPRNRDRIVAHFITETDASHLLCVDSDIRFRFEHVAQLARLEVDFACLGYRLKGRGESDGLRNLRACPDHPGMHEVDRCAAGFMLLTRRAVAWLVDEAKDRGRTYTDVNGSVLYNLFGTNGMVERADGTYVAEGEDYAFCRRWVTWIRGRIYTVPGVLVGHFAEHEL